MIRALRTLGWVEAKLYVREPITLVFAFAFPVIVLFVMAEIFGSSKHDVDFRNASGIDYYLPAYIGIVIAALAVVTLPVHLAGYRERGVLRRLRASAASPLAVLGAQVGVTVAVAAMGSAVLAVAGFVVYRASAPSSVPQLLLAFAISAVAFAAVGLFLAGMARTGRAAQGVGLILFFVMMMLSGAGPPRTVMTEAMRRVGDFLPLTPVIKVLQDAWMGYGIDAVAYLTMVAWGVVAGALALRLLRSS